MPPTYKLIANVVKSVKSSDKLIIGIDGYTGAGKSRLAQMLANELQAFTLELDKQPYINASAGKFGISKLHVMQALAGALQAKRKVIIDGVMLLEIFSMLGIKDAYVVYVKHINHFGEWEDRPICDLRMTAADAIKNWEDRFRHGLNDFHKQLAVYHHDYKPTRQANVIYLNQH